MIDLAILPRNTGSQEVFSEARCQCHPVWQQSFPRDQSDDELSAHVIAAEYLPEHGLEVSFSSGWSIMLTSASHPSALQSCYITREGYGIYFPDLQVELDIAKYLKHRDDLTTPSASSGHGCGKLRHLYASFG